MAVAGKSRIQAIRQTLVPKGIRSECDPTKRITISRYPPEIRLCIERSRLVTESYKMTEGQPEIIRRAKALQHFLSNMSIYIDPYQLIVGNETSEQHRIPIYVEVSVDWIREGLYTYYKNMLQDKEREELLDIFDYWQTRTIKERWKGVLPAEANNYTDEANSIFTILIDIAKGRPFVNFERLFKIGLKGIIDEATEKYSSLGKCYPSGMDAKEYVTKRYFYEAVLTACNAVIQWSHRYGQLAGEQSTNEKDGVRRQELVRISEICSWVPENPPRTLHEALQFFYFIHLAQRLELIAHGAGYRFDQLMNPFYLKDLQEGTLTKEDALELLQCLWLKVEDVAELAVPGGAGIQVGALAFQNFALGGVRPDGIDASNEMSRLMLDATLSCRSREPALVLRYHDNLPDDLIDKATDLLATGHGMPAFFNDKVIVPYLEKLENIPREIANDYSIVGCVRWGIPGKSRHPAVPNVGAISLLKCLELALNNGVDGALGRQTGYPCKDASTFESLEDVKEAYLQQVNYFAKIISTMNNIGQVLYAQYLGRPFSSALVDNGIESGKESIDNMYREALTVLAAGPTNVANSLAVLQKLVFQDKVTTMKELLGALKNNWGGYEDLRQLAINRVPKFGNDDTFVDDLMRWVHIKSNEQFKQYKGVYGGTYVLGSSLSAGYYAMSLRTLATPDGRRNGEPCSDATVSPAAGSDKKGPTAVLNSVAKLSPLDTGWGDYLLNQKFLPQHVSGEYRELFKSYIKSWSDLPIWHIQFNMLSKETLEDAQRNPGKYSDLVVRVAGYSAYFLHLPKEVQDDIIRRTEQSFS